MMRALASFFLFPPTANLLLILFGWWLTRYLRRLGGLLIIVGVVSLWLLSTPVVSSYLQASIEKYPALNLADGYEADAIVVLGAAHFDRAREFGGQPTPVPEGLTRLHYAAYLHRQTGLPLMTTGGPMNRDQDVHAGVMASALALYEVPVKWQERDSATTWQNALFSAEILLPLGITDVLVVTESYHMARAVMLFELAGFNVTAAPTRLSATFPMNVLKYWKPGTPALHVSYLVLHEYIGLLWYRLRSPVGDLSERNYRVAPR